MKLRIDIVTLFPEAIRPYLAASILGKKPKREDWYSSKSTTCGVSLRIVTERLTTTPLGEAQAWS